LLLGIPCIFLFAILYGTDILDAIDPQAGEWKTIAGELRNPNQAESFLCKVLEKSRTTALSVAVVKGSHVVFHRSVGIVDKETNKPVDKRTVFRTASLSKPVFAYLVMKLVDEGLLSVNKPLHLYLDRPLYEYPDYKDLKGDARYKLLTARLLLSHQSGFPNWRRINRNRRLDFKFVPGKMFKYSGEGYRLLQFILEKMTGKGLNRLAKERIFNPLGMTNSSFVWEKRFDGHFAVNLRTGVRRFIEGTRAFPNAAYSLLTNTADYAKFLLAVMNGEDLKPKTLEMMLKPQVDITSRSLHAPQDTDPKIHETIQLAWSMGWGRFRCVQGEAIFHVGYEEGCDNYAVVFLDRNIGMVLQSVITGREGIAPQVAKELIGDIYSPFSWLQY
jgi:CubicO group peptidase (beta-lactamase class C family)